MRSRKVPLWALDPTPLLCVFGLHSLPRKLVHKFNGGRGAWLCRRCRIIVAYGHDRPRRRDYFKYREGVKP